MNRRLATLSLGILLASVAFVGADDRDAATPRDLQRLQDAVENLDESLKALEPRHPQYREFQDRADAAREDVIWLKVQIRRHRLHDEVELGASRADVEDIRTTISRLQRDIDHALNPRSARELTLPEGRQIMVRLEDSLSSRTARREDRFEASVAIPVRMEGRAVIPAGTRVRGIVQYAERGERPARGGRLELTFDTIYLDERTRTAIRTRVVSVQEHVDKSAEKAGIGAVLGGVVGSILGGKKGAIVGILVGGTGAVVASKGEEVELPEGTILTLTLEKPLPIPQGEGDF
jgi:hypothetical protein